MLRGAMCYTGALSTTVRCLLPVASPARETCLDIRTGPSVLGGEGQGDLLAPSFSVPARLTRSVLCGPLLQARTPFCAGLWRACGLAVRWLRPYLLCRPPGGAPPLAAISPSGTAGQQDNGFIKRILRLIPRGCQSAGENKSLPQPRSLSRPGCVQERPTQAAFLTPGSGGLGADLEGGHVPTWRQVSPVGLAAWVGLAHSKWGLGPGHQSASRGLTGVQDKDSDPLEPPCRAVGLNTLPHAVGEPSLQAMSQQG